MSFAKQRGIDICGRRVTCGAQHSLILTPTRDGLIRRPLSSWPPVYINCELNNAEIWLTSAVNEEPNKEVRFTNILMFNLYFIFILISFLVSTRTISR